MEIMEIILLAAGGIIFVLSFFIPERRQPSGGLTQDDIKALADQELEMLRDRLGEAVEEAMSDGMEQAERSLERLSNEKIMAVNEYSDTVLAQIHKNHEEVMFLYDMLNSKHANLKSAASEASRAVKEAEAAIASLKGLMQGGTTADAPKEAEKASPEEPPAATRKKAASRRSKEPKSEAAKGRGGGTGRNREKIMELYGQGQTVTAIAKELGIGVGEVKLVIDLNQS